VPAEAHTLQQIEEAFAVLRKVCVTAVMVGADAMFCVQRQQLAKLALGNRMASHVITCHVIEYRRQRVDFRITRPSLAVARRSNLPEETRDLAPFTSGTAFFHVSGATLLAARLCLVAKLVQGHHPRMMAPALRLRSQCPALSYVQKLIANVTVVG
jgi:hypothetical protein